VDNYHEYCYYNSVTLHVIIYEKNWGLNLSSSLEEVDWRTKESFCIGIDRLTKQSSIGFRT